MAIMKRFVYGGLIILAFANILVWPYAVQGGSLRVVFFDVGQGDAIFIETPQGHQILIDGGPNSKVVEKVGQELPFWDKSLDLVILTHPDADHITGLVDVLNAYEVKNILWTGLEKETKIFASWKESLAQEEANIWQAQAPQRLSWSEDKNAYIEIVYPKLEDIEATKAVNDTSIIAKLSYGRHSFLFPGDISKVVENKLVQREIDLDATVLKVPHHGSKSSSSVNFLHAISPEIAVIQVGKANRYGHPTEEVLSRLSGILLLRTDQNGGIIVETNGSLISIQTGK
jgi:competence protein ComEC